MQNKPTNTNPYVQIILVLILGAVIGLLTVVFVKTLNYLNQTQQNLNLNIPYHLVLSPLILLFIILIKRNTLYFPFKISELVGEKTSQYWSRAMLPVHFVGPLLSHAVGMSLGREGAVVLFSSALSGLLKLSWSLWGPILSSIGFASVVGNYWVAPVFMFEVFKLNSAFQMLLAFIGSMVAVLVGRQLGLEHLFAVQELNVDMGFFTKIWVLFLFGMSVGFIMRYYKMIYHQLTKHLSAQGLLIKMVVAILLSASLYLPEFRVYQSLGLQQFTDLSHGAFSFVSAFTKLALTLLSTAVGFLGGEFIPLVFSGVNFGASFFQSLGYSSQLGGSFGAFILFASGTRLKWTSFLLMTSLMGFSWCLWIYFVLTVSFAFAGRESLYQKSL